MKDIQLSIIITTYNQEKYISQTIKSVLCQKTNFNFEILIGEDCSQDKTLSICEDYKKKFPEKIRLIKNKKNLGLLKNFKNLFLISKGKYIALLAGDDYWIDRNKLQKQINFLEKNPDYSIVYSNSKKYLEKKQKFIRNFYKKKYKTSFNCEDLISYNFIPALTVCFKKPKKFSFPKNWNKYYPEDWTLFILLSQNYKIKYFNEPMAVYRITNNGLSSGINYLERLKKTIPTLKLLKSELEDKYKNEIQKTIKDYTLLAITFSVLSLNFSEFKKQTKDYIKEIQNNIFLEIPTSCYRNFKRILFRFN